MALEDLFREEDIREIENSFIKVDKEMANASAYRGTGFRDWMEDFDDDERY